VLRVNKQKSDAIGMPIAVILKIPDAKKLFTRVRTPLPLCEIIIREIWQAYQGISKNYLIRPSTQAGGRTDCYNLGDNNAPIKPRFEGLAGIR
jgi:hypothetical protein